MPRIGLIHNPNAKKNRKDPARGDRLRSILGDQGLFRETPTPDAVEEVAREFREAGVTVVCSSGGDGSGHHMLSRVRTAYEGQRLPAYLPLRSGTMNTVPNALGIYGRSESLLKRAVACAREGIEPPRISWNSLLVDGRHVGFLTGFGLAANFLEIYYDGPGTGPIKAVQTILRTAASALARGPVSQRMFANADGEAEIDGEALSIKSFSVALICTVPEVGLGIRAAYRGNEEDGKFHVRIGNPSVWRTFGSIGRIWAGTDLRIPKEIFCDRICRKLTIRPQQPFTYMVDGDLYRTENELTFEAGPKIDFVKFVD